MNDLPLGEAICAQLAAALVDEDEEGVSKALAALGSVGDEDRIRAISANLADDDETVLHIAAREASTEAVSRLISWGADVNIVDGDGSTPIANALWANRWHDTQTIVLALIEAGASCAGHDRFDLTPLHHAAATGTVAMAAALIEAGADVNALDTRDLQETPLHRAAEEGNADVIGYLLAAGATPGLMTADGINDLFLAVQYGHREAATLLLQAGCAFGLADHMGRTPLHFAAYNGDLDLFEDLITAGADLQAGDSHGITPVNILTAFGDQVEHAGDAVTPLEDKTRLAILITVIMQNSSGTDDFTESSFVSTLHENNRWLVNRCERLCKAVAGLAAGRCHRDSIPRIMARVCHDIFEYVVVSASFHLAVNDGSEIIGIDHDMLHDQVDDFKLAFISYFTGVEGFPKDLSVETLLELELAARK